MAIRNMQGIVWQMRCCHHRLLTLIQPCSASALFSSKIAHINHDPTALKEMGKAIGISPAQQKYLKNRKPEMPVDPRLLKVAIIGAANAGKSTLANQLLKWRFSAVSKKPHTTRHKVMGVLTEEDCQLVFMDSPGITEPSKQKKFQLERTLLTDPHEVTHEADLIVVVVDVSVPWGRTSLHTDILKVLHFHPDKPSVLVLNKIDTLKSRRQLLSMTKQLTNGMVGRQQNFWRPIKQRIKKVDLQTLFDRMDQKNEPAVSQPESNSNAPVKDSIESVPLPEQLDTQQYQSTQYSSGTANSVLVNGFDFENAADFHKYYRGLEQNAPESGGWDKFDTVFMMSALEGDGVNPLKDYLIEQAKPGAWLYHSSFVTDQHPMEIARLCIWEKLLDHTNNDIPYRVMVTISDWHTDESGILRISCQLHCKKKRELIAVLGHKGSTISQICKEASAALKDTFRCELSISVRVVSEHQKIPQKKTKRKIEDNHDDSDDEDY